MLSVVKTFGISDILQEAVFDRHSGLTDYTHPEQKADFRIAEKLQKRWTQVLFSIKHYRSTVRETKLNIQLERVAI